MAGPRKTLKPRTISIFSTDFPPPELEEKKRSNPVAADLTATPQGSRSSNPLSREKLIDKTIRQHWQHNDIWGQLALVFDKSASFSVNHLQTLKQFVQNRLDAPQLLSASVVHDCLAKDLHTPQRLTDLLYHILIPSEYHEQSMLLVSTGSPVFAACKNKKDETSLTRETAIDCLTRTEKNWLFLEEDRPGTIRVIHRTNYQNDHPRAFLDSYFVFIPPNTNFPGHTRKPYGTFHHAHDKSEVAKAHTLLKEYRSRSALSDIDEMILAAGNQLYSKVIQLNQLEECKGIDYTENMQLVPTPPMETEVIAYRRYANTTYWQNATTTPPAATTPPPAPPSSPTSPSPVFEHKPCGRLTRISTLFQLPVADQDEEGVAPNPVKTPSLMAGLTIE